LLLINLSVALSRLREAGGQPLNSGVEQSLAADGATACFSSNLFSFSLNAARAPQLKASVGLLTYQLL